MESIQLFTVFVLAVGAIHLTATVCRQISGWWDAAFGRRATSRQQNNPVSALAQHQMADDWYVFFHCSTLTPPDGAGVTSRREHQQVKEKRQQRTNTLQPRARASV